MVNEALKEELSTSIHALAIQTKTEAKCAQSKERVRSPPCMGGMKHELSSRES